MNVSNGVINYAFLFLVCILLFICNKLFKKFFKFNFNKKNNLGKLLSSFFSLFICVYFIFTVDTLLSYYVGLINLPIDTIIKLAIIVAFLFVYFVLYLIIKRFIYNSLNLVGLNPLLSKQTLINKLIVVVSSFLKTSLFLVYTSSVLSILFVNLYISGFTKPFVNTNLVNSDYNQVLKDLDQMKDAYSEIQAFTNLFNKDDLYQQINEFNLLVDSVEQTEKTFMDDVFSDLPRDTQKEIETLYKKKFNRDLTSNGRGLFGILVEDDYYKDVLTIPTGFVSKIPVINQLVYKNDLHLSYYQYIESNYSLILYINEERDLFTTTEFDFQKVIASLNDSQEDLYKVKDPKNKLIIEETFDTIDKYFIINDWIIDVIEKVDSTYLVGELEPYQLIDEEVNAFLRDKNHLDSVIKQFNEDYQKNLIKNRYLYSDAYALSKTYLNKYQETSLKIEDEIDPNYRLGAAFYSREIDLDDYIFNGEVLQLLLSYLNTGCNTKCNYDQTYMVVEMFTYGYLYDFERKELSDAKLDTLLKSIDEHSNKQALQVELQEFTDQLLYHEAGEATYLAENYQNGNIRYHVLKLLYLSEEYTSKNFRTEAKSLLK